MSESVEGAGTALDQSALLERYAELVVRVGANVQPGQDVALTALVEHAPIARAVAEHAYAAGARRVLVEYTDMAVRRSAVVHAPLDALGSAYPFELDRMRWLREHGAALISLTGNPNPNLFEGLDAARVAATRSKALARLNFEMIMSGEVAWTIVAAPNEGWARQIFGEPDVARLWHAVAIATRCDQADPVAAWRAHLARLEARATALTEAAFDRVRFTGPGTDLEVGLIRGAHWLGGGETTTTGIDFVPNLPTEEVFTTPDWRRAEGHVACTRPLITAGSVVSGLRLWLEGGRIVRVEADDGADVVRAQLARDERATFLGEISMVDGSSPIRRAGVLFHDTLFDENAGCHIAWGRGFSFALDGGRELSDEQLLEAGVNVASDHTDIIVGGPGVSATGIARDGSERPIIDDDRWVFPVQN